MKMKSGSGAKANIQEEEKMEPWSNTDFPYQCLLDVNRTKAFQAAIRAVVKQDDAVLDAGSGSGILSFFAALAGAKKVYAVEVDSFLASCLERSVRANNLGHIIEVIHGDIHSAELPESVDVFICEMMDTGLMDEMQVTAINSLYKRNVITDKTRLIPFRYETFIELGFTNFNYYGFKIFAPKHDWPHYSSAGNGWLPTEFHALSKPHRLGAIDFQRPIESRVDMSLPIKAKNNGVINAVRISARAHLAKGMVLGATNALNGDKILPIDEARLTEGRIIQVGVSYQMSGGLDALQIKLLEE
jgi:predicted RNA methylase